MAQEFELGRLDHATYDAHLVMLHEKWTHWTRSKHRGNIPVPKERFRRDAQQRLTAFFSQQEGLGQQDFNENRPFLVHLAHDLVSHSGLYFHTGQNFEEFIRRIRNNLAILLRFRCIAFDLSDDPALTYKARPQTFTRMSGDSISLPVIEDKKHHYQDCRLAQFLLGPDPHNPEQSGHTAVILAQAAPFLMEIDDAKLEIRMRSLRAWLRSILSIQEELSPDVRFELLSAIADDWDKERGPDVMQQIGRLEEQIDGEQQWQEEHRLHIADGPIQRTLDTCFRPLLQRETFTEDDATLLRERLSILTLLLCRSVEEAVKSGDNRDILNVIETHRAAIRKLPLTFGDVPHLDLAHIALRGEYTINDYWGALL